MKVIGLIAEYNPFHNGHIYHINKVKERYPDSILILVLNGYFTQRGTPSILSKEDKVKVSLEYGIDLVIELPVIFGTQSSDIFAYKSIEILNHFKVDTIIFGSESNNSLLLKKVATIQLEDKNYNLRVKDYLNQGNNYPTALAKALNLDENITEPNDLLGISYYKAVLQSNPNINVETIKRTNSYHDLKSNEQIVSASNIREKFKKAEDISSYLPAMSFSTLVNINENKMFILLKYKILSSANLNVYLDVDEGIEYRLLEAAKNSNSLTELINSVKTKRYTYNKINRMLFHILLGYTKEDNDLLELEYCKVLGFSKTGRSYLNDIREQLSLPIKPIKGKCYSYELTSAFIYELLTNTNVSNFDKLNIPIQKV